MKTVYKEALTEVSYIINSLEKEELEKIPQKFRNFIEKNKARYYTITFDIDNITDVKILKSETRAILSIIYEKYLKN